MKRIPLIRRKSLVNAGIPNHQLIDLSQKNEYFKNRAGDTSFFTPFDALLIFIASELFEFLPFRNVSGVVNDLVKNYRNLYGLIKQNPKQYLVVEVTSVKEMEKVGIEMSYYVVYPLLIDSLKLLDWENRKKMVLVNFEKIYLRVENLFQTEGLSVPNEDVE